MEQLIPIASKLQDVLGALGQSTTLDLPQIVVVGGQSSGKSSVLEGLVGRSFLPRGHGIVTRRPLILQLYNTRTPLNQDDDDDEDDQGTPANDDNDDDDDDENGLGQQENIDPAMGGGGGGGSRTLANANNNKNNHSSGSDEWGEFLHMPGRKFYSFSSIRHEIVKETDRLTGTNKGINPTPIHLKIYSPHVLALTMVDLPGMAKIPVGDQPDNIEEQIHQMSLQYISNPNAIILAVTSANTDLANSDALKLACAADPRGERTVGVLTKLDLMDPGTDAADILLNKVIPLRHGYIAVVNRGQKDINADASIRDGLKKEDGFFRNHPVYSRNRALLAKCGTRHLAKTLNTMLMHHIRDCLPELKNRISHMMCDVQVELDALGTPSMNSSRSSLGGSLLNLLSKFATNFAAVLDGKGSGDNNQYGGGGGGSTSAGTRSAHKIHELFGGARVSYIFTEVFAMSLLSVRAFDGLSDEEIRMTICNANGTRPALFVPEISFDILARRQIARLEQPGIQCVDLVYEELQRIASQSEPSELTRFPVLRERMVEVVASLLKRCVGPTQMMVSNLIKIELAYINTSHPDFIGGSRAVANLLEKIAKEGDTRRTLPVSAVEPTAVAAMGGATPLSSSSLSNYYNADAPGSPTGPNTPYDAATGGIMNFIFRGGKPLRADSARRIHDPDGPPSIVHLPQVPDSMRQSDVPPTERERVEMEVIKALIESYFGIVRKNFIDMVPKTIMYFLVNHVRDAMQNELVSELYRDAEIGTLMQEAEDIAQRRHTCMEMKDLLGKALEIVNEVRDYNTFK